MKLTDQQEAIIASQSNVIVINAYAGTGKTSTLKAFAAARPNTSFLYLTFDAASAANARLTFPANVKASSSHSLAFGAVGYRYKEKLGFLKALDVTDYLAQKMSPVHMGANLYSFGQAVLTRLGQYFASGSMEVDPSKDFGDAEAYATFSTDPRGRAIALGSLLVWQAMKDVGNTAVKMTHDGYLKLWALSKPDLSRYHIMLDEAQDTNPCVLSILSQQKSPMVIVGDTFQNIYSFRGAVNAMQSFGGEQHRLTKSFRFGQTVADRANLMLGTFCGNKHRIEGVGGKSRDTSHCYISRTNGALFKRAVDLMGEGHRLSFVGGLAKYSMDLILDAWHLKAGLPILKDPFVRRFKSFEKFADYADQVKDKELLARIKIVEDYGSRIPDLIKGLRANEYVGQEPQIILTTAHKSKGMEWGMVTLDEDFPNVMEDGRPLTVENFADNQEIDALTQDEINLIYVALTRGKQVVNPFSDFERLESYAKEQAQHEVLTPECA